MHISSPTYLRKSQFKFVISLKVFNPYISICKVEFTQSIMSAYPAAILIVASFGWCSLRENVRCLLAQEF